MIVTFYFKNLLATKVKDEKTVIKPLNYYLDLFCLYNSNIVFSNNEKLIKLSKKQIVKLL
jgi:hypothetical protein